jgi:hypothetical protein
MSECETWKTWISTLESALDAYKQNKLDQKACTLLVETSKTFNEACGNRTLASTRSVAQVARCTALKAEVRKAAHVSYNF